MLSPPTSTPPHPISPLAVSPSRYLELQVADSLACSGSAAGSAAGGLNTPGSGPWSRSDKDKRREKGRDHKRHKRAEGVIIPPTPAEVSALAAAGAGGAFSGLTAAVATPARAQEAAEVCARGGDDPSVSSSTDTSSTAVVSTAVVPAAEAPANPLAALASLLGTEWAANVLDLFALRQRVVHGSEPPKVVEPPTVVEPVVEPVMEPRYDPCDAVPGPERNIDATKAPLPPVREYPPSPGMATAMLGHLVAKGARTQLPPRGRPRWINSVWYGYPMSYGVSERQGALRDEHLVLYVAYENLDDGTMVYLSKSQEVRVTHIPCPYIHLPYPLTPPMSATTTCRWLSGATCWTRQTHSSTCSGRLHATTWCATPKSTMATARRPRAASSRGSRLFASCPAQMRAVACRLAWAMTRRHASNAAAAAYGRRAGGLRGRATRESPPNVACRSTSRR